MNAIQRTGTIKGNELPQRLAKRWHVAPDDTLVITVRSEAAERVRRATARKSILDLMDENAAFAESNDVTEEGLLSDES